MNVAFYAPLKPPTHPTPSGDRTLARLLKRAVARAGHRVELASAFRSFDGEGSPARQARLRARGEAIAERLLERYVARPRGERPQAWLTYHLHHKAPDWLGPTVCRALGIPYLLAEASHAAKQARGPWRLGYEASVAAIRQASAVLCINPVDRPGLEALGIDRRILIGLAPFIDCARTLRRSERAGAQAERRRLGLEPGRATLVTVAMMRRGDKLASYAVLAEAMRPLLALPWQLLVIGDGPAAGEVHARFHAFPAARVRFAGACAEDRLAALLRGARAHLWPACNEALGMVFLEAAALGVPSVAGAGGGVGSVVIDGETGLLAAEGDAQAFSQAVRRILENAELAQALGTRAALRARERHDLPVAAAAIGRVLASLVP